MPPSRQKPVAIFLLRRIADIAAAEEVVAVAGDEVVERFAPAFGQEAEDRRERPWEAQALCHAHRAVGFEIGDAILKQDVGFVVRGSSP